MPRRRQATRRFLATVLFTDIVESTEHAARLGDRAWRDLLRRHHVLVRRALRTFGGREMNTSGDGFLALFETPENAVRCADAITATVSALGISVRAGVHTGECEFYDGQIGGMAVHIGSRVAALAGPGEVLVTGSVRDLMTGSDRRFDGGTSTQLKGVAEPWRVHRLVPCPATDHTRRFRRLAVPRPYLLPSRRRTQFGLAGLLVLALALATQAYRLTGTDAEVVVGENEVGVIGSEPGAAVRVSVEVGQRPTAVAAGFGSVWVTNSSDDSVSRIDRRSLTEVPIPVGVSPSGVAVGAGSVWVANSGDSTVSRIDPATSRATPIPVLPGPTGIVFAFGSVWVTNALAASVTEIHPETNETEVVEVGAGPSGLAAGAGSLWVTNQGDGTVTRLDPRTHVADPPVTVGDGPVGIAATDDAAWVASNLEGSLWRIDADDLDVTGRTLSADGGAYGVAARGDDVWVSNEYDGTLMRVRASSFRLADKVTLSGAPLGLAYVGDDVWFTSAAGGSALHRGGVLTVVGQGVVYPDGVDPAVLDPTVGYDPASWRLAQLTHDGLVGLRRTGAVGEAGIVPNLATSLPKPSDGGLTYTFHLRKGIRYSTGEPVLAGDIRRGIERTAMHDTGAGYLYAPAIRGGRACVKAASRANAASEPLPDCDLSKGIVTDDRAGTVIFHLKRPQPEFVWQLSLVSASAVPQGTPVTLEPGTWLPSTGPYMVSSYLSKTESEDGHGELELVRNPHFREWSHAAQPDGYPDRIVLQTGYTDRAAVKRVTEGRADLLWFDAPREEVDRLRAGYGSQLHTSPGPFLRYVLLNATRPPFADRAARRAVAYALDREALVDRSTETVTCQLIPPDFPGYTRYCPFTVGGGDGQWRGPDRAEALRLLKRSGTRGAEVELAVWDHPLFTAAGRRVAGMLDRLGYRVTLTLQPGFSDFVGDVLEDPDRFDAALFAWGADYVAASAYPVPLASCDPVFGFQNFTGACDEGLDAAMDAALAQQAAEPGGATDAWAAIDQQVVDAAATIPFSVDQQRVLVSRRVGNDVRVHRLTGADLALMWVQ